MSEQFSAPLALIDASVLVPHWSRVALRALAIETPPRLLPVWSTAIVAETWRILTLRALATGQNPATISRSAHSLWELLDPLFRIADCSTMPAAAAPSPLRDLHDTHLWCAALNAGVRYVVSHNTRDFPHPVKVDKGDGAGQVQRHLYAGIEFLTAIELIEDVVGADAAILCGRSLPVGASIRSGRSRR